MTAETSTRPEPAAALSPALFQRVLLPIDGSELSLRAFRTGLELARPLGGTVVALHAVPPFNTAACMTEFLAAAELRHSEEAMQAAARYLDDARALAEQVGVPCECHCAFGEQPHEAILKAVDAYRCELIVMASHGWHGLDRLILGSETQKVLANSRVPVLVCR